MTEPEGSVVRANDPALDRWYSRDVAAIAARHELTAASYFIDAEKRETAQTRPPLEASQHPVAGLTVGTFYNSHLVYALTWYGLAFMVIIAAVIVIREERKSKLNSQSS